MPELTPTVRQLQALARSERLEVLESLVATEFKSTLFMADDEDLPEDESFFDMGFTSLLMVEVKERLEGLFGRELSATVMFNSPTLEQLLEYLTTEVLADFFGESANEVAGTPFEEIRSPLWDDVLSGLTNG